eukprot:scaffold134965_cov26-Prasinocladus_malaysianus.AAC.1
MLATQTRIGWSLHKHNREERKPINLSITLSLVKQKVHKGAKMQYDTKQNIGSAIIKLTSRSN